MWQWKTNRPRVLLPTTWASRWHHGLRHGFLRWLRGEVYWFRSAHGLEVGVGLPREQLPQNAVQSGLELVLGTAVPGLFPKPQHAAGELHATLPLLLVGFHPRRLRLHVGGRLLVAGDEGLQGLDQAAEDPIDDRRGEATEQRQQRTTEGRRLLPHGDERRQEHP